MTDPQPPLSKPEAKKGPETREFSTDWLESRFKPLFKNHPSVDEVRKFLITGVGNKINLETTLVVGPGAIITLSSTFINEGDIVIKKNHNITQNFIAGLAGAAEKAEASIAPIVAI